MIAAIALGSNLGDRDANLREALRRLAAVGNVVAASGFHDTEPVGYLDQPRFLNAAALLDTELEPLELLRALLAMELEMGRDRASAPAKGPRVIDLDLLLMGDVVMDTTQLVLPHPAMHERAFVLVPLTEIASEMMHPQLHKTVSEILWMLQG
jgi:2-amino-4-hydroxy-6-hydroxymethyldihydropteridine diphosphokinase